MIHAACQLWRLLDPLERRRAAWLATLMLFAGVIEMSGVMSVVPLVAALTSSADPCVRLGATAGKICSAFLPGREPQTLALLVFALIACSNLVAFCVTWLSARLTWSVWRRLSGRVLAAYLSKPYEFFFESHSATAVRHIVYETERFSGSLFLPMMIVISRLVMTLGVAVLVVAVDPLVSLAVLGLLAGVYLAAYRQLLSRIQQSGEAAYQARERIGRITTETIAGIRELRMLASGAHFAGSFEQAAADLSRQYVYGVAVSVLPRYLIETAAFAVMLGLAIYLRHAMGGWQSAAPLLAFYIYAAYRLLPQLQQIFANVINVQQNVRVADAFIELIGQAPRVPTLGESVSAPVVAASLGPPITLESVTYRYPGAPSAVLKEASMQIPRRATVGLIGSTGAGKSTVIDLIAGLIRPDSGIILLDQVLLHVASSDAWRTHIGYVPQVTFLLDDTIRRNIAFGLPNDCISQQQVEHAACAANIHDFIVQLPQGYDTRVGERGIRLSGGQRQRLVIARALYRDPEVLIFDEATSALDLETEQAVMEAIRALSHRKTLLIISHRASILEGCDLIYEVAEGKIRLCGKSGTATSA